MTWEIALGMIALAGFLITIGTLSARLSAVLTRLEVSVKELSAAVAAHRSENGSDHRFFRQTMENHEKRITVLEERGERGGTFIK